MQGAEGGLEEISELIRLIQSNETTHMYISRCKRKGDYDSQILTFSPIEPSKELYEKGKILPVEISEVS